jgi:hypothetical protein
MAVTRISSLVSHLDSLLPFASINGLIDITQDAPETAILTEDEPICGSSIADNRLEIVTVNVTADRLP